MQRSQLEYCALLAIPAGIAFCWLGALTMAAEQQHIGVPHRQRVHNFVSHQRFHVRVTSSCSVHQRVG